MAAVIGARRTSSAYERLRSADAAADVVFDVAEAMPLSVVRSVPGVAAVGRATSPSPAFWVQDDRTRFMPPDTALIVVDGAGIEGVDRVAIRRGRTVVPGADEVIANRAWLDATGLRLGDALRLRVVSDDTLAALPRTAPGVLAALESDPSLGWTAPLTVVGEAAGPADIARDEASSPGRLIIPEDVAARAWRVPAAAFWGGGHELLITVAAGSDPAAVARDLEALPVDGDVVATGAVLSARVSTATRPYIQALTAFAALVAMVGLVVAGGAVARQAAADARIDRGLRLNGADRRLLITITLGRAAIIGAGAAVTAVAVALRASPWLVLGPSAAVEPPPAGIDLVVLVLGVLATVAGLAVVSLAAAWRTSEVAVRGTSLTPRRGGSALPLVPRLGFELAFPRRGSFLMRSALLATLVALATATAVAVVSGSLRDLIAHPERHGGGWDVAVTCHEGYCEIPDEGVANFDDLLGQRPDVAGWSFVTFGALDERGRSTPAIGVSQVADGPSPFTIVTGRGPVAADEVVLGTTTVRHLGAQLGDMLHPDTGGPLEIVGVATFTGLGPADGERASLGTGAGLTMEGLRRHGGPKVAANAVLVTGADVAADELATRLRAAVGDATVISRDAARSDRGMAQLAVSAGRPRRAPGRHGDGFTGARRGAVGSSQAPRPRRVACARDAPARVPVGHGLAKRLSHRLRSRDRCAARLARRGRGVGHDAPCPRGAVADHAPGALRRRNGRRRHRRARGAGVGPPVTGPGRADGSTAVGVSAPCRPASPP